MAEICPVCGLPGEICVCREISREQQRIRVRLAMGKWRRKNTIIDGIDNKDTNLGELAKNLKSFCACGGTSKNNQILLQGDHRNQVRTYLVQLGYPKENIEVQ
ncbi:translation initiation factor [Candidatus Bathyarchaeota archaeon]|nr:translation initiation factor [Candidatus Bathyarchaeota archaeon]